MKYKVKTRRIAPDKIQVSYPRYSGLFGKVITRTQECEDWLAPLVVARAKANMLGGLPAPQANIDAN
jgi:hypothetical protein